MRSVGNHRSPTAPTACRPGPAGPSRSRGSVVERARAAYLPRPRRGDQVFALWRLAATTGMRRGELLGLLWRHLDLDAARLRVEQQLLPTRGGVSFGPPKKPEEANAIALDPTRHRRRSLRHHRATQLEAQPGWPRVCDQDLVFCDGSLVPRSPQLLTTWFARQRKAAGIPTGTLHILRHTSATIALSATPPQPLHVVAASLGDDPRTLSRTYAHLLPRTKTRRPSPSTLSLLQRLTNGRPRKLLWLCGGHKKDRGIQPPASSSASRWVERSCTWRGTW